jgi:hypothetical protein
MSTITLLNTDDLRLWRACERRYWMNPSARNVVALHSRATSTALVPGRR